MCKNSEFPGQKLRTDLVSDATKTATYVNAALKPLLSTLKTALGAGGVVIEIINEPEWCMSIDASTCTTDKCVAPAEMQRFVGTLAAAVHDVGLKVTVGSAALKWDATGGSALGNWWNDSALAAATSGKLGKRATLDHYQVHYYDWMFNPSWGYDPCRESTSYWALDKPTVVGELPAASEHYSASAMMACAEKNGFMGDMFWAYNDPGLPLAPALPALRAFAKAHGATASYSALSAWLAAPTPPPTPPPPTPCTDVGPDTNSCEDQKSWGKCGESWMVGYCCKSCFDCAPKCGK